MCITGEKEKQSVAGREASQKLNKEKQY